MTLEHAQASHNLALAYEKAGRVGEAIRAYGHYLDLQVAEETYAEQIRMHIAQLQRELDN